jgi:hypothetical protein
MLQHITKVKAVIMVSVATTVFLGLVHRFPMFKDFCIVVFLSWLTGIMFDLRDNLYLMRESAPFWMKWLILGNTSGRDTNNRQRANWNFEGMIAITQRRLKELVVTVRVVVTKLQQRVCGIWIVWSRKLLALLLKQQGSSSTFL